MDIFGLRPLLLFIYALTTQSSPCPVKKLTSVLVVHLSSLAQLKVKWSLYPASLTMDHLKIVSTTLVIIGTFLPDTPFGVGSHVVDQVWSINFTSDIFTTLLI